MSRIDPTGVPERTGPGYPPPFDQAAAGCIKQALGAAGGLTDFGVNPTQLHPAAWFRQGHWHSDEDEFVFVLSGELTSITNAGEQPLHAGMCATFPKNVPDGHHPVNRSGEMAVYLGIGSRSSHDVCSYPDTDLHVEACVGHTHRDGTPYPSIRR